MFGGHDLDIMIHECKVTFTLTDYFKMRVEWVIVLL